MGTFGLGGCATVTVILENPANLAERTAVLAHYSRLPSMPGGTMCSAGMEASSGARAISRAVKIVLDEQARAVPRARLGRGPGVVPLSVGHGAGSLGRDTLDSCLMRSESARSVVHHRLPRRGTGPQHPRCAQPRWPQPAGSG